ncbi:peroxin-1, partial [Phenoliferia sp. Uapishka_3]
MRTAQLSFISLKHCLVNLPISITGPLQERAVAPQSLVVELSYSSGVGKKAVQKKVYVGWTGMPSQLAGVASQVRGGNASADRVEIDPQFADMFGGVSEGTIVTIELLRNLPVAASVSVTPLSPDDWEILETNAEFVETHLLSQVRAVKEGSVVGCWVGGTTLVRFVVDATSPAASPALLLSSDTELIVAPKTRNAPQVSSPPTHDLSSSSQNKARNGSSPEWEACRRKLLRLLPRDLDLELGSGDVDPQLEGIAYVSKSLYKAIISNWPAGKISIGHYVRPKSSDVGGSGGEKEKGKEEASTAAAAGSNGRIDVKVKVGKRVPPGHVWVGEKIRKEIGLADGAGSFELLRIAAPLPKKVKLEREKDQDTVAPPRINGSSTSRPNPRSPGSTVRELPPIEPLQSLAGVADKLDAIRSHVVYSLASKSIGSLRVAGTASLFDLACSQLANLTSLSSKAPGLLVTGASGAGKTALVRQISKNLELDHQTLTHTMYIDCSKHTDERLPALKAKMKDWFDEAYWHAPTLLILDNLDRMLGAELEHVDSFPALHLAHSFLGAAVPALTARPIILLATAQSSSSVHPLLSTTHLLGETVSLRGPSSIGRRDIITTLVQRKTANSNLIAPNLNYGSVSALTEGYLPADLRDLVDRAIHQAAIRASTQTSSLELTLDDFTSAQVDFVPLSLRDVKLQKSEVQWADIGGLHETRRILRETLEWPTKYGAIFADCPLRLRSGLLLYGFPGCGKTLLASAVAKECGLNFISVKGPEILNKYIGASEKSVRDLFERASAAKPCILFFDEFDSIAPKRGHDSTGVTDRVVNQMLTQMDGAEGLDGVYVLAATSRPDLIDPALLRPGRLDKSLLCDMPNHDDRLEIMQACSRKVALSPTVDLSAYAAETQGFSGADLQALIYNAHLDAIHATLAAAASGGTDPTASGGSGEPTEIAYKSFGGPEGQSGKVLSRADQASVTKRLEVILASMASSQATKSTKTLVQAPRPVTHVNDEHLQKSLKSTRPSVPPAELVRLRRIYSEFVSGRSANGLPSGEASDEVGGRSSLM